MTTHTRAGITANRSARILLSGGQKLLLAVVAFTGLVYAAISGITALLQVVAALVTFFYVAFVGLSLYVGRAGRRFKFPAVTLPAVTDRSLPLYTVLMPIAKQQFPTIALLVESVGQLQYPDRAVRGLLLLEEKDTSTRQAVERALKASSYRHKFEVVVVPAGGPMTKPHACNYALTVFPPEQNEYVTILDVEDRPQREFLLTAVADMRYNRAQNPRVGCAQGRLQFFNPKNSLVSTMYGAEYATHFYSTLPGFVQLGLISPLGGTSNHFLREALEEVAGAFGSYTFERADGRGTVSVKSYWEAENVTEDADMAMRLAACGWFICMTRAITLESAPTSLKVARDQRSRWNKGYAATALAWSRQPLRTIRQVGIKRYLAYLLFIGGTPLSLLLNPWVLGTTVLYTLGRLFGQTSITQYLELLFPTPVFYPALFLAIVGNAMLVWQILRGVLRLQENEDNHRFSAEVRDEQFGLAKRLLLSPIWWLGTSISAYQAAFEMLRPSTRTMWRVTPQTHDVDKASFAGMDDTVRMPAVQNRGA